MKQFTSIQLVLTVSKKEYLTTHYIRIYLTGEGIEQMANTTVGAHNKIFIPPKGINHIYFPEFDVEKRSWKPYPDESLRPTIRTYTHRGIDLYKNEIWIDFVAHGEEGIASAWAINAQKGSVLGVMMKARKRELYPNAKNYVLVGDATAIPVLGAILEDLPETAKGICIIEVHGKEDEQHLQTKADIRFEWLHNTHPQKESKLPKAIKNIVFPEKNRFAYIAAEFSAIKEIRDYLRNEKNWQRGEFQALSYWKAGFSEDQSNADRHADRHNN